jgi:predicted dehydrogenase
MKIGLLGCGRISARHIEAIAANPGIAIGMVCDIVESKAKVTGEKLGVAWTTDLKDLRPDTIRYASETLHGSRKDLRCSDHPL